MKLRIAWIGRTKNSAVQALRDDYIKRISNYIPTDRHEFASEEALLKSLDRAAPRPFFVTLDSRGKHLSSEELATFIGKHQDSGTQVMMFAIGPADGWSEGAITAAQFQLSMGKMTLAHELALVVLTEQIYRALTILKGHPYHSGH
jgi:23S rRNA (pseudouridine1915-N3)-methyltransferase